MFKQNFDKIILVFLLGIYIFLQSNFFLNEPQIWPDEAYLADVAINILNEGRVGTDIWGDTIVGIKNSFYWYPPVYINTLALWFKIFGFSILNQRLLSLSLSLIFLVILYFFFQNFLKDLESKKRKLISLGLILFLIFDNTFLKIAKMGRTEMMVVTLGFLSLFICQIAQDTRSKRMLILVGLLLGLTAMIHLLGLFFFITALITVALNQKKIFVNKEFYQFLVAFFIPIIIWLISIFPNYLILIAQLSFQGEFRNLVPSYIESVFRYLPIEQKIIYVIYILLSLISFVSFIFRENTSQLAAGVNTKIKLVPLGYPAACSGEGFIKRRGEYSFLPLGLLISWLICFFGKLEWYVIYVVCFMYPLVFLQLFKKRFLLSPIMLILLVALFVFNIKTRFSQYLIYTDKKDAYFQFGELVKSKISDGKIVYLSTTPDLYFIFKGRNPIYELPLLRTKVEEYKSLLNKTEYMIINLRLDRLFVGNLLDRYIVLNKMNEYEVGNSLYRAKIIELVPADMRRLP